MGCIFCCFFHMQKVNNSLLLSQNGCQCMNVTNRASDSKVCLLEDAIRACVNFYDVGTGGKHCDDAVCFLCHLCWRVYYLIIGSYHCAILSRHQQNKHLHEQMECIFPRFDLWQLVGTYTLCTCQSTVFSYLT